jgi:putative restriction endonuclease
MTIRRNWTREELILTINLYCKTPFGRLHKSNPDVVVLASLIDRTPSAVAWKLVNFASLDPNPNIP